jgi:hypothetical protein
MADIEMCINESCPLKKTCYRYMADPNEFIQPYGEYSYKKNAEGLITCDGYLDYSPYKNNYDE